ncbi:peroxide stress protein YaaA [Lactobacillus psittaci]|nr:peroxide stress protein YaaA [Lactobacillus psittaci]
MKIIISPAKKMVKTDSFLPRSQPVFLNKAEELIAFLRERDFEQLSEIWQASPAITREGQRQLADFNSAKATVPAIATYSGIQYQYMAADLFTERALDYSQQHLRILSGLYGVLRPFDAVCPYRLELKNKMIGFRDYSLYHFWGSLIHDELFKDDQVVINLASKEYARVVKPYLKSDERMITIDFLEKRAQGYKTIGTHAKMSRGEMTRFICENQIKTPEELQAFSDFSYKFDVSVSDDNTYVFKTDFDFKRK